MMQSLVSPRRRCGLRGMSTPARFVAEKLEREKAREMRTISFGAPVRECLNELEEVAREFSTPDWDGHGAQAISPKTVELAREFVELLPRGIAFPEVGPDPRGFVSFDWLASRRRSLMVSVTPMRLVHYASIIGENRAYGTEVFSGRIPHRIIDLINDVSAR